MVKKEQEKREYKKGEASRSDVIRMRISAEERRHLEHLADAKRMSLSDLLRSAFFFKKKGKAI